MLVGVTGAIVLRKFVVVVAFLCSLHFVVHVHLMCRRRCRYALIWHHRHRPYGARLSGHRLVADVAVFANCARVTQYGGVTHRAADTIARMLAIQPLLRYVTNMCAWGSVGAWESDCD